MRRDIKQNSIFYHFICDLSFLFLLLNLLLERCLITQEKKQTNKQEKQTKKKRQNQRNLISQKISSNSEAFSLLLVTTSIGRRNACPYIFLCPARFVTMCLSPHGDRKIGQARDLYDSIHTLRYIVSVCVPCRVFFPDQQEKVVFSIYSQTL